MKKLVILAVGAILLLGVLAVGAVLLVSDGDAIPGPPASRRCSPASRPAGRPPPSIAVPPAGPAGRPGRWAIRPARAASSWRRTRVAAYLSEPLAPCFQLLSARTRACRAMLTLELEAQAGGGFAVLDVDGEELGRRDRAGWSIARAGRSGARWCREVASLLVNGASTTSRSMPPASVAPPPPPEPPPSTLPATAGSSRPRGAARAADRTRAREFARPIGVESSRFGEVTVRPGNRRVQGKWISSNRINGDLAGVVRHRWRMLPISQTTGSGPPVHHPLFTVTRFDAGQVSGPYEHGNSPRNEESDMKQLAKIFAVATMLALASSATADLNRVGPTNIPSPPGQRLPALVPGPERHGPRPLHPDRHRRRSIPRRLQETACLLARRPRSPTPSPPTSPTSSSTTGWSPNPMTSPAAASAVLVLALEAAFASGAPAVGQQMVFARIRVTAGVPLRRHLHGDPPVRHRDLRRT